VKKVIKPMIRYVFLILLMGMASCTTIKIDEADVFDVKRTIGPEYFKQTPLGLEEVTFVAGEDLHLKGWFITHPSAKGTVLFYGGNGFLKETARWLIKSITDQQMNLFVFNYRGYGDNPGKPSVSGIKTDGMAAYNYLVHARNIDPSQIIIHSHSLGTLIGSYVAEQKSSAGLVLESPITDAKDYTDKLLPKLLRPFIRFDVDSSLLMDSNTNRISRISVPLLVVVGKNDPITPPAMAKTLYRVSVSHEKSLKILKNGSHNDLPQREDYRLILSRFYSKAIRPKS